MSLYFNVSLRIVIVAIHFNEGARLDAVRADDYGSFYISYLCQAAVRAAINQCPPIFIVFYHRKRHFNDIVTGFGCEY